MPSKKPPIRNPIARSPLLRKGGVHIRSKSGQRMRNKLSTRSALNEWLKERGNKHSLKREQKLPFLFYMARSISSSLRQHNSEEISSLACV